MNTSTTIPGGRPVIQILEEEHERLYELATSALDRHPQSTAMLLAELDRAVVCDAGWLPSRPSR